MLPFIATDKLSNKVDANGHQFRSGGSLLPVVGGTEIDDHVSEVLQQAGRVAEGGGENSLSCRGAGVRLGWFHVLPHHCGFELHAGELSSHFFPLSRPALHPRSHPQLVVHEE